MIPLVYLVLLINFLEFKQIHVKIIVKLMNINKIIYVYHAHKVVLHVIVLNVLLVKIYS